MKHWLPKINDWHKPDVRILETGSNRIFWICFGLAIDAIEFRPMPPPAAKRQRHKTFSSSTLTKRQKARVFVTDKFFLSCLNRVRSPTQRIDSQLHWQTLPPKKCQARTNSLAFCAFCDREKSFYNVDTKSLKRRPVGMVIKNYSRSLWS